jgi:hypothetical protein
VCYAPRLPIPCRSRLADRPADSLVYLTGSSGPAVRAAARGRADQGLMVSPLRPDYLTHVGDYPAGFGLDNGVFSKATPFDPEKFKALVDRVAADRTLADRCLFAVAPDVVGDPVKTRENARHWLPWLRSRGLPAAFVLQDGCESLADGVPWGAFDVLFVGGSTSWKVGRSLTFETGYSDWIRIFRTADERGVPVHVGRVNSWERSEVAFYGLGAKSADGTFLAFGPDKNLPELVGWLDRANRHHKGA